MANVYPLRMDLILGEVAESCFKSSLMNKVRDRDFPGDAVVKNPPANAGDEDSNMVRHAQSN